MSTARVSASHERSNTLVHVAGATCIGWRGEQGIVDVPRGVLRRPPDDHFVSPSAPLDGRARGRFQLVPNARRYRDPALRSDSGFDPFHPKFLRLLLEDITALIFVRPLSRRRRRPACPVAAHSAPAAKTAWRRTARMSKRRRGGWRNASPKRIPSFRGNDGSSVSCSNRAHSSCMTGSKALRIFPIAWTSQSRASGQRSSSVIRISSGK